MKQKFMFFLEFSCIFYYPTDVGNLIFGSSDFLKSSLCILKFLVQVLLKPSLKDFEHYLPSMWNEHSCAVVWTFFGIALLWDWNENWPFPVATTEFSKFDGILSTALSQHHILGFFSIINIVCCSNSLFLVSVWQAIVCSYSNTDLGVTVVVFYRCN